MPTTDEDREAAAQFAARAAQSSMTDPRIQAVLAGKEDDSILAQALMRHREAAVQAERAAVVAWLRRMTEETSHWDYVTEYVAEKIEAGEHRKEG